MTVRFGTDQDNDALEYKYICATLRLHPLDTITPITSNAKPSPEQDYGALDRTTREGFYAGFYD